MAINHSTLYPPKGTALCQAMVRQTNSDDVVLTNNCIAVVADQTRKRTLLTSQICSCVRVHASETRYRECTATRVSSYKYSLSIARIAFELT